MRIPEANWIQHQWDCLFRLAPAPGKLCAPPALPHPRRRAQVPGVGSVERNNARCTEAAKDSKAEVHGVCGIPDEERPEVYSTVHHLGLTA